jgi:hypothetical protein
VHDRTQGEQPDESSTAARYATPDTFFVVEIDTDSDSAQVIERLLERLYSVAADEARRLLLEAKRGLLSELEESSYRLRSGRMADLGFIEYYEALEVYRYVDPQGVANSEPIPWRLAGPIEDTVLPALFASPFRGDSFFTRVLREIRAARLIEQLGAVLLALLNRVLSADRVDPADVDAVEAVVQRAHDTLSLGLEHLAEGDIGRGVAFLERLPLIRVFQVGYSLTVDRARRARQLRERGSDDPGLDPLLEPRPLYPRALDVPPTAGARPFRSREDLRRLDQYLSELSGR